MLARAIVVGLVWLELGQPQRMTGLGVVRRMGAAAQGLLG